MSQDKAMEKRRANPLQTLSVFLEGRREEISKILPPGLDVERVIKTAIMAAMESPGVVGKCTPISIYRSVVQASLLGLMVGDGRDEGYLIPYKNACTFRASYMGWAKVARRSEGVDVIRASVIYQNDHFQRSEHPPSVEHVPQELDGNSGDVVGAVAVAYTLRDGRHDLVDFSYVNAADLVLAKKLADAIKPSPAWRSWPDEMRKKVAIRRLCKMLPRNEQLSRLMKIENNADNGIVDVPDPDIDDMKGLVEDTRFLPEAQDSTPPLEELPEPEVIDAKGSKSEKLLGKIKKNGPQPKEEAPPPPDFPDYGGPEDDVDF